MNLSFIPWYYKTPVNISKGKSRYLLYECRFNRYFFRTTLNFKIMYLLEFKDCRFLEDVFMFSSVPIFSRGFATLEITSPEPQSTLIYLIFYFHLGSYIFQCRVTVFFVQWQGSLYLLLMLFSVAASSSARSVLSVKRIQNVARFLINVQVIKLWFWYLLVVGILLDKLKIRRMDSNVCASVFDEYLLLILTKILNCSCLCSKQDCQQST